jgi:hypothetical protein
MKSLSEFKRPYSVCPMRAASDRELKETDLRVLMALCAFTNRAGVCWPSMATLMEMTDLKSRTSIDQSVRKLKRLKYVRQLQPKDYQKTKTGWKTNRYQVLWEKDMALPSLEEVQLAKPLQLVQDQDDVPESKGGLGDAQPRSHTRPDDRAERLAHAFCRAVQAGTGQVVLFDNVINHTRKLPEEVEVDHLVDATLAVCRERIAKRQGVPSVSDVAVHLGV